MIEYSIESIRTNLPELKAHPAIKLPMMSEEKLKGLEIDIYTNGQHTPIWIIDGMIFDGRNRYKVIRQLNEKGLLTFEPDIQEWPKSDNEDLGNTLLSLNMHRNNYNSQQCAAYGARYLLDSLRDAAEERMTSGIKVPEELIPQGLKGKAAAIVAMLAGSNEKYVQDCSKIKNMNEHFLDFIIDKKMTIAEGLEFITLDANIRNFLYSQMKMGLAYKEARPLYEQDDKELHQRNEAEKFSQSNKTGINSLTEQEKKKLNKNLSDIPNVIFTIPVDEQFQELVSNLIYEHYNKKLRPILATWDANDDATIAMKLANVAKYINKKVTSE